MTGDSAPPRRPSLARDATSSLAAMAAILICTVLVYRPGLGGGFVFDDFQNLLANPALAVTDATWSHWVAAMFSSPASDLQRPLSMLSFALNHYFSGFDAAAMKATNLVIHLLNVVLVHSLVRAVARLLPGDAGHEARARRIALFAAAFWALHPINLMAVLYVIQRMESLSHTFVFIGLLLYASGRRRQIEGRGGWPAILAGVVGCTLLGLAAKESAALLPLYAALVEIFVLRWRGASTARQKGIGALFLAVLVLPAALGLAWLLPRSLDPAVFGGRNFTLGERLLTEPRVVLEYLHWSLLPDLRHLSLYHDDFTVSRGLLDPPATLLAIIALALLASAAWLLRARRPLVALGIGWFLGAQLLTATIVPLELVFEHRNYFASLGVCLALADLCTGAAEAAAARRQLGLAIGVCLALFLAGTTWLRADEWSTPLRFAETEAAKHPDSPRATYELGRALVMAGGNDPQSAYTRRALPALEAAMRAPGSGALPYQAALTLAARTGQPLRPQWWQGLQDRLRANPAKPESQLALIAMDNCAVESICAFPPADMLATFDAALDKGDHPGVLSIYGKYALYVLGDRELALRLWQEAVRTDPGNAQFRINLAMLYSDLGRVADARGEIVALRRLGRFGQYRSEADALEKRLPR